MKSLGGTRLTPRGEKVLDVVIAVTAVVLSAAFVVWCAVKAGVV